MNSYNLLVKKLLSNPKVRDEYDTLTLEYDIAYSLIKARTEANMTQGEVAQKMNTTQSAIARIESGRYRPSIQTIHKYAVATKKAIEIRITP